MVEMRLSILRVNEIHSGQQVGQGADEHEVHVGDPGGQLEYQEKEGRVKTLSSMSLLDIA